MIRYHSIPHFAYFQVHSLLNHSKKNTWFDLGKKHKNAQLLLKLQWFALFKIPALPPPPPCANYICMYLKCERNAARQGSGRGRVSTSTHNLWNRGGKIEKTTISLFFASFLIKIYTNHGFLCVFQPFLLFELWNRSLNYCRLFSLYPSWANNSKFD